MKKTLIVSDLHIGHKSSHIEKFLTFLPTIDYDTIILNGDILDFLVTKEENRFKEHFKYIKTLLKLIKGKKCYYIIGNHDKWMILLFPISWIFGINIKKVLNYKGYRIEHGDFIEYYMQIRHFFNKDIIYYHDVNVASEINFHNNTIELAKIKNKPFIVGHSHSPLVIENIIYDEGDWVEHDTYLLLTDKIELKKYE